MASSGLYTFNGIEFCLTAGTGHMDGVAVNTDHNIDAPEFMEALRQALEFYPLFYAYGYIENESQYYGDDRRLKSHLMNIDDAQLTSELTHYQALVLDGRLTINAAMDGYGQALFTEKQRRLKVQEKVHRQTDALLKPGYVYLLNEVNGDHYKIGRTVNPKSRLKTFSVKLPYKVEFEAVIETDDMYSLEAQLHHRFADKRVDGEWFDLTPDDVSYIKSLAVNDG